MLTFNSPKSIRGLDALSAQIVNTYLVMKRAVKMMKRLLRLELT